MKTMHYIVKVIWKCIRSKYNTNSDLNNRPQHKKISYAQSDKNKNKTNMLNKYTTWINQTTLVLYNSLFTIQLASWSHSLCFLPYIEILYSAICTSHNIFIRHTSQISIGRCDRTNKEKLLMKKDLNWGEMITWFEYRKNYFTILTVS